MSVTVEWMFEKIFLLEQYPSYKNIKIGLTTFRPKWSFMKLVTSKIFAVGVVRVHHRLHDSVLIQLLKQ
jgi:hypothetical protein